MRKVLVVLLSLVPAVALAQPATPAPEPEVDPAAAPPAAPGAPPAYVQPYAPPVYVPPAPDTFHHGTTFEVNLGIGFIRASAGNMSSNSSAALGGANLGVGGWLNTQLALSVRIAGVTYVHDGGRFTDAFFGPSLQYWFDNNFWIGGGAGLGVLGLSNIGSTSDTLSGFSLDLRAGYSFSSSNAHTFNLSVELNPGWYSINTGSDAGGSQSASYTGVALLAGYQYL